MRRGTQALVALLLLSLTLAGCGLGTSGGYSPTGKLAGPLANGPRLDGVTVKVGSKNFSEQKLLGKLAVILFQSAGADVQDLTNIPGSSSARQAMLQDQTNFQWEYTGTAWIAYMKHDKPIPDERQQFEAVRDEDLAQHKLHWYPPAPMNNTYAFALPEEKAQQFGITKMSELGKVPADQQTFCIESEFNNRNDGFQPWLQTYGLPKPTPDRVKILDTGPIYEATHRGLCTFGEVFTTDGRNKSLNLRILEDDKRYFPNYNLSGVATDSLHKQAPQLEQVIAPVAAKLDNQTMMDLNARIDVNGEEPVDVAYDWLKSQGFIS